MLALWARCPEYAHSSHRHPNFAPHGAHVLLVAQATRLQLWKRSLKKHRLMCPHNIYFLKITLQAFMLATADLDCSRCNTDGAHSQQHSVWQRTHALERHMELGRDVNSEGQQAG